MSEHVSKWVEASGNGSKNGSCRNALKLEGANENNRNKHEPPITI